MAQPTAHTGPSGLVIAPSANESADPQDPTQYDTQWDAYRSPGERLEVAFEAIRQITAGQQPAPVSRSVRFSFDTALGLAEAAPRLYAMDQPVKARFDLIATFLRDALTELDQAGQR